MKFVRLSLGDEVVTGVLDAATASVDLVEVGDLCNPRRLGRTVDAADGKLLAPVDPPHMLMVLAGWQGTDGSGRGMVPKVSPKMCDVSGDGAQIVLPASVPKQELWVEPELCAIVGRPLHRADVKEAASAILGFSIFNDVTAYEYLANGDIFSAKSIETFAVLGPCVETDITNDDVIDGLTIACRVNGDEVINARSSDLKVSPAELLSALSSRVLLKAGTLVSMGCPPPQPPVVRAGDEVVIEIEGIGRLTNTVVGDA